MSFRELRNFTEIMRTLGYPRPISMENFRTPNFELVADLLYWLIKRYDPSIEIVDEIGIEQERVMFLTSAVQAMANKAGIRLAPKKLYGADGYAVKELLKIATVLHQALKVAKQSGARADADAPPLSMEALTARLNEVKRARQAASEVTTAGAEVYDLLAAEQTKHEERAQALSRPLDLASVERSLAASIDQLQQSIEQNTERIQALAADERDLLGRIEKRKQELERGRKRLESLRGVRPAFMDEFEKLEATMAELYGTYLERFRNVEFLEHELDVLRQDEQQRLEERERLMKAMQSRLREEERRVLRGEQIVDDYGMGQEADTGGARVGGGRRARALGRMDAADEDSAGSGTLGSQSGSGEITLDEDDDSDGVVDDDGDGLGGGHGLRAERGMAGGMMVGRGDPRARAASMGLGRRLQPSGDVLLEGGDEEDSGDLGPDDSGAMDDPGLDEDEDGDEADGHGMGGVRRRFVGGEDSPDLSDNEF